MLKAYQGLQNSISAFKNDIYEFNLPMKMA